MFVILPIVFALAGVALLVTHRRYKASKTSEAPRVVVKGHTFSESIETTPTSELRRSTVENVRLCCIVGAGRVGAITGIVLASHNPDIQFCIVDSNERVIQAWKSDSLPLSEPGLEDVFFDDQCLKVQGSDEPPTAEQSSSKDMLLVDSVHRRRKLSNLTFSTNVHAGVAAADLIFLCLDMETGAFSNDSSPNTTYLNPTLRSIAHASTGHKVIVQRTAAPYGATQYIKAQLKTIASPSATFTVLANPDFTIPGSTLAGTVHPQRVIIGHIYAAETSTEGITALKRLYTPWVEPERIVTMDAWSAELGRIVSRASIAQQGASLGAVRMVCERTEASAGNVGWMLGCGDMGEGGEMGLGIGLGWLRDDVRCFMDVARRLGMVEVVGYWEGVLKMDEVQCRRAIGEILKVLEETESEQRTVTVVGAEGQDMAVVLRELRRTGATVKVWDGCASKGHAQQRLGGLDSDREGITVADSLEAACAGSGAVVLQGSCRVGDEVWQTVAEQMEEPKVLCDIVGGVDRVKMRQLGFKVL
ncbi:hypothetical protein BJX76DRAFT_369225 [Aspergillus varians]